MKLGLCILFLLQSASSLALSSEGVEPLISRLPRKIQLSLDPKTNSPDASETDFEGISNLIEIANTPKNHRLNSEQLNACAELEFSDKSQCLDDFWSRVGIFTQDPELQKIYSVYKTQKLSFGAHGDLGKFFAQHLTKALFESDYRCRFPSMGLVLQEMFPDLKWPSSPCERILSFHFWKNHGEGFIDLDSISKIQLIKVSPGAGMSAWGHIMFNFLVCPPQFDGVCQDQDAKNLIFTIHEPPNINAVIKTLGFTRLVGDFMTLKEAYYGYTVGERRKLTAYNLNLTSQEKKKIAALATEINARGFGAWNHLLKNCTTTAAFLLNFGLNLDPEDQFQVLFPATLERQLLRRNTQSQKLVESVSDISRDKVH